MTFIIDACIDLGLLALLGTLFGLLFRVNARPEPRHRSY